jgi:ankyrin repeat protein
MFRLLIVLFRYHSQKKPASAMPPGALGNLVTAGFPAGSPTDFLYILPAFLSISKDMRHTVPFFALPGIILPCLLAFSSCAGLPPAPPEEDPGSVWALLDRGETEKARELFLGQENIHARDSRGRTPLHAAVELGDADLAAFFITLGAPVDAEDNRGRTPLGICAEKDDPATARVLAVAGSDIHHPQAGGESPARTAVSRGGAFLTALITPASLQSTDGDGRSLLHLAAESGVVSSLEEIIRSDPAINKRDRWGRTALDICFSRTDAREYADGAERLVLAGGQSASPLWAYFAPAMGSYNYNIRTVDGTAPLHYAAGEGHTGYVRYLLDKGADLDIKNASGATPLHEAARAGQVPVMEMLLVAGAGSNAQDAKGNAPIHIAMPPDKQREGIALLLSHGANPNLKDEHGDSPLHIIITLNRNVDILRTLLENGADGSLQNIEGKTPLYVAIQENRNAYIPLLLQYQADIFAADNQGDTPLGRALRDRRHLLPVLITPETVRQSDPEGNTALHIAVRNNEDTRIITLILDQQAAVNARNKEGDTGLHLAVRQNAAATGELLLSRGANIFTLNARSESPLYLAFYAPGGVREWMLNPYTLDARDGLGNSILHYAAQWRLDAQIPLIVQKSAASGIATGGGTVNAAGETPLFLAVKADSASTVKALIDAGTAVSGRDALGNTALHAAVRWNAPQSAETLIRAGIDINAHALNGKTPLHDAVRLGNTTVASVLLRAGAALEVRDTDGNTPFMEAIMAGFPGAVEQLASQGADPLARNSRGDTPLHIAVAMERSDLVTLLLGWGASIHAKNALGRSPFQIALTSSPRMVSTLLTKDRIAAADDEGHSPLHIALLSGASPGTIKTIIDQGGRVSAVDSGGRTPLRMAADRGDWDAAGILAAAGSDPFAVAGDGKTPADLAIASGETAVQALFSGKAISARDQGGNTVLHYAAQHGASGIISLLLQLGADKTARNYAAESPGDIAHRWNRADALALLSD